MMGRLLSLLTVEKGWLDVNRMALGGIADHRRGLRLSQWWKGLCFGWGKVNGIFCCCTFLNAKRFAVTVVFM